MTLTSFLKTKKRKRMQRTTMKTAGAAVESATPLQPLLRAVQGYGQYCSGQWQPCLPSAGGMAVLDTDCIWLPMMQRAPCLFCPEDAASCILGNGRMHG